MEIVAINSKSDIKKFIDFPHDLYKDDTYYVPEIYMAQKELMDPKKNPFFQNAKVQLYLAYEGKKIVGRIAAIRNNNHNKINNENAAFFGFFDIINNYQVAKALLDTALAWAKKEQLDIIYGPTNFSLNDTAGMLIEGFDDPPKVMMTYNKPYYPEFMDQYGFKKSMDLLAYYVSNAEVSPKSIRIAGLIEERLAKRGITIRHVKIKNWNKEVQSIRKIYNGAWKDNWGFVPMTEGEFDHLAEGLRLLVKEEYIIIAEDKGEMVGFAVAIPDINSIVRTIKKGRLFPTGLIKLLLGKNKVKDLRIITLGVLDNYRKIGIEAAFYAHIIQNSRKNNIVGGEASWVLESNIPMNQALINMNAKVSKRYRLYELPIA